MPVTLIAKRGKKYNCGNRLTVDTFRIIVAAFKTQGLWKEEGIREIYFILELKQLSLNLKLDGVSYTNPFSPFNFV